MFVNELPEQFKNSGSGSTAVDHELDSVLGQFDVHPDLQIDLFAAEPMLVNPTTSMSIIWDAFGFAKSSTIGANEDLALRRSNFDSR